ncbi:TVP38/TMEM64 family protein [Pikeienuella piscinae]|uniref:TVP38/TMEM64 family membrane protein n=1 Tax=Pikeienuella piscinae TaxID=2748098 RepID=A0A7L5BSV0_9RHOB|nr:TVP38/TMEM64 family protein [Pikeienuella piscinae]QIE54102.1 TVP38/TMEM64 family protein [Pikeienuella piscinae]
MKETNATLSLRRAAPLALAFLGAILLYAFGRDYLSFDALRDNRETLLAWRDAHYALAALTYAALYAVATALSFPGGLALTLAGGFLFGPFIGAVLAVTGATAGALAIFLAARTGLGDALRARAGGWVKKAEEGFRANEISFLLMMRLVPAIPFFAANLVPAFLGATTFNYAWTTFVGIIPGALVYASVGAGLGVVFEAGGTPDLGLIFEPQVLLPLLGLAALSALPIFVRLIRRQRPGDSR